MSRLHSLRVSIPEVETFLRAEAPAGLEPSAEVTEGRSGVVMFEVGGVRRLRSMRWGFPRPGADPRHDGAGIIGLVADLTNPMWEGTVVDPRYRCIVPITHFANPDGEPGSKTRTWFSLADRPIMSWADFCRNVPGVGPVYAGMTMEANAAIPPTNDRMPALLEPEEHERWLRGSIRDVIGFQFRPPVAAERMVVLRTDDPWRGGAPSPAAVQMPLI